MKINLTKLLEIENRVRLIGNPTEQTILVIRKEDTSPEQPYSFELNNNQEFDKD